MPYVNRMTPVSASTNGPADLSNSSSVYAEFRYTSEGRTTTLVVAAFAGGTQASHGKSALDTVLASCDQGGVTCESVQQTVSGPVIIRHAPSRGVVEALSFRASGVVVVARSGNRDTTASTRDPGEGLPGFAGDVDELVNIAALAPEPKLEDSAGPARNSGKAFADPLGAGPNR